MGLYFKGQFFANGTIYYQPINWQTRFTVSPIATPVPLPTASLAPLPTVTLTPTATLPNMGPTSPPHSNSDLTITYALVAAAIIVISVTSLLLYIRHLKKTKAVKN
jgi:hypothetical protein